ncbi:MAG: hypothetical protein HYT64_02830 [Candidatus Yanofskybacteria bacterium]|nr:hypothetical protein [Candidatus Yanofskybacteria bacterium]
MSNQKFFATIGACFLAAFVVVGSTYLLFGRSGDGIEAGKTYALAYTYKATLKGGGPARVFDFADRNLPRTSVIVPLNDDRGMPLVEEISSMPPSTVRKVVASVSTRVIEGVTYPGYTYVVWQYHLSVVGPQSVVPEVIPSK